MQKKHNKDLQKSQEEKSCETKGQVKDSMYVEFADDFLDLNPDHCLNSDNMKKRR